MNLAQEELVPSLAPAATRTVLTFSIVLLLICRYCPVSVDRFPGV